MIEGPVALHTPGFAWFPCVIGSKSFGVKIPAEAKAETVPARVCEIYGFKAPPIIWFNLSNSTMITFSKKHIMFYKIYWIIVSLIIMYDIFIFVNYKNVWVLFFENMIRLDVLHIH
jgi:hypothetical protein